VLRRCTCSPAAVAGCGSCTLPRCCGPSAAVGGGFVCLDGDAGGVPCADIDAPLQFSLATDADGNLYVASNGASTVHRMTPGGCVTTLIDPSGTGRDRMDGARGLSVDGAGNVYVVAGRSDAVFKIARDGARSKIADVDNPIATAVDADGNVSISSAGTNTIRQVVAGSGEVVTILDGTGLLGAGFAGPRGVAVDGDRNVYAVGEASDNVFKIEPDRTRSVILDAAGDGINPLDTPFGVAADRQGNVYVTGFGTDNVFKVTAAGQKTQILGAGFIDGPREIAVDMAGNVFVTGQSNTVVRLTPQVGGAYAPDIIVAGGPGVLTGARGLAVDPAGRVFVAGETTDNVRMWAPGIGACGNGIVEGAETCDYGSPGGRCCCSVKCQLQAPDISCNDGSFCTASDRCDAQGLCTGIGLPCPGPDGDGDCTESCDENDGSCTGPDPVGSGCDDGLFCNGADSCVAGECTMHAGNPCAGGADCADVCSEAQDSCFEPLRTECNADDNPCTVERCDGQGACRSEPGNAGIVCGVETQCRAAPRCSGISASCPQGEPLDRPCSLPGCDPNRSVCLGGECVCRPPDPEGCGNGVAEAGEVCGEPDLPNGECCTGCRFAGSGTRCRVSTTTCDVAEFCTGFSAGCPADEVAPGDTPCEDGDPCTDAGVCVEGSCRSTTVCQGVLDPIGPSPPCNRCSLRAGGRRLRTSLVKAICSNPAPSLRRAVSCAAQGFLVDAGGVGSRAEPAGAIEPDCVGLPPDLVKPATKRKVRRFATDNPGDQVLEVPIRLNDLTIRALKKHYRKQGFATIVVCVEFEFDDATSVTLRRELVIQPRGTAQKVTSSVPATIAAGRRPSVVNGTIAESEAAARF
jgi:streptogramin lyase